MRKIATSINLVALLFSFVYFSLVGSKRMETIQIQF